MPQEYFGHVVLVCWLLMFLPAWPRRQSSSPMVYEISFQGKRWLKLPSWHDAATWSYFFRYSGWVPRFHNPPPRTALRSIWGCCEVVYSAAFHSEIHEIRQQDAQHRPGDSLHHHQDQDTSLVTFRANVDTEKSKSSINHYTSRFTAGNNIYKWRISRHAMFDCRKVSGWTHDSNWFEDFLL